MWFIFPKKKEQIDTLKKQIKDKNQKIKNQAEELDHLTNNVVPQLKKENKELKKLKKS